MGSGQDEVDRGYLAAVTVPLIFEGTADEDPRLAVVAHGRVETMPAKKGALRQACAVALVCRFNNPSYNKVMTWPMWRPFGPDG